MNDKLPINISLPDNFLEEEVRSSYTVTSKMKKVWAVELDLINEFNRVCEKFNLKYYADSGTLLGAVRDKGFIPWDDDIDVVMLRKDYNYLIENCAKEFKKPYFLQSAYSDNTYFRTHAQLRNSYTTAMLPNEACVVKFNQGIFLDIFPLDYLPETDEEMVEKFKKLANYRKIFRNRMYGERKTSLYRTIGRKIYSWYIFRKGDIEAYKSFEKLCEEIKGEYVDKISYYLDIKKYKRFPVSYFGDPIFIDFEFVKIPVPQKYDLVLKSFYGEDYMTPRQVPSGHQNIGKMIIDPDTPYTKTIKLMKEKNHEAD